MFGNNDRPKEPLLTDAEAVGLLQLEKERARNFHEHVTARSQRRKIRDAARRAVSEEREEAARAVKKAQDDEYAKLTPTQWKEKYGVEKPKIGLIEPEVAVRKVSRQMTAMALHTLAAICEASKNDAARVSAAKEILDRGWGKAALAPESETRPGSEITVVFGDQKLLEQATAHHDDEDDDADTDEAEE